MRRFRYWIGFLAMANDDNNSAVGVGEDGTERLEVDLQPAERERIDSALRFSREVLEAAGATQVCWTGLVSTTCRAVAGWGTIPRAPSSTGTASRTT